MVRFEEIADRVWVARHDWYDVNTTVIAGDHGAVVVDTASAEIARGSIDQVRGLHPGPLLAVVNTHGHFDHVLGNAVFTAAGAELVAHENNPVEADRTLSSALALDLGDRVLEVLHPGRGHTDNDLVVRVPDADVILAGDLIEESAARNAVPGLGEDCFPMDWPATLDLVLTLITADTVVVPGHGAPVDKDFVWDQRSALGVVAETIRDLAGRGVPLDRALDAADWPYPKEELAHAVQRGYQHLPRAQKRLPLI